MDVMAKVAAAALTAAVLGAVLRKSAPEFALVLALCAGVWMVAAAAEGLGAVAELMEELAAAAGLSDELLRPVVKTVIISVLTRVTGEICRAAGEGGIAAFVETAGTVLAMGTALPLVRAVTVLMTEILI